MPCFLRAVRQALLALIVVPLLIMAAAPARAIDADVLLRGGTIYDGTGVEGAAGDVALRGEKIAAVGRFDVAKAARIIDCTGLVIAPGFIDLHTHSDRSIPSAKARPALNYLLQGCTSVVTGNCGGGPVEVGKFYDQVDRQGAGTNIFHLVPHGALRQAVMGSAKRVPTTDELEQIKRLADRGMREGAWGMSTGLIYVPGVYAETAEIAAIAAVVAAHGGIYATHLRNEGEQLIESLREAIEIGRQANVPVEVSHLKITGKRNWGHIGEAVAVIDEARRAGVIIHADQYPYTASSTSLFATLVSAEKIPGGTNKLFERMKTDAALDQLVRKDIRQKIERSAKITIASCKKYPQYVGKDLREIAAEEKLDVVEVALKILSSGGATAVNHAMSEDDVRAAMAVPWVATGSDGSARALDPAEAPHPRNFGTFPRKIGNYALKLKVVPLGQAIRSCSGLPADILGLSDRGYLRPGCYADLVVFDPKDFIDRATFDNPQQYATGARYLFIAGHAAIDGGKPSETLYGRAIRRQSKLREQ
jgi:N-acyl-D-aspartate/D-glutamate deacylase